MNNNKDLGAILPRNDNDALRELFMVERDCCTSGNCGSCADSTPRGQPMRVWQTMRPVAKATAEAIAKNWNLYKAVSIAAPPCECGHACRWHLSAGGPCQCGACDCDRYAPATAQEGR